MTGQSAGLVPVARMNDAIRQASPLRLKKRPDFLRAAGGRKSHGPLVSIHALARVDGNIAAARVGFTVTKKVGGAVERNRIKRRLREVVRTEPDLCMKPSHDYVIIARRDVLTATHGAILAGLRAGLSKVHGMPAKGRGSSQKGRSDMLPVS